MIDYTVEKITPDTPPSPIPTATLLTTVSKCPLFGLCSILFTNPAYWSSKTKTGILIAIGIIIVIMILRVRLFGKSILYDKSNK